MKTNHSVILGDSRQMNTLDNQSIHLVVTSPPYWQLKDYGNDWQIGYGDSYEKYINHLNLVWKETHRVLKPGCRLCVNIGDQFARAVKYGRYKVMPIRTEIIKFCEILGFDYMGAIIWRKVTTTNTTGGAVVMGSYPFPRNGILKLDYEFILIFRKNGKQEAVDKEIKMKSRLTAKEWNTFFSGHWTFPGEKQSGHQAAFPVELPSRLIKMFSFIGDIILDPFLGSGTTSLAAMGLSRHSIGYEINHDYLPIIREKLDTYPQKKHIDAEIYYSRESIPLTNLDKMINELPYHFKDPHKLTRMKNSHQQNDRNKKRHGEKMDSQYFSVREIIAPNIVFLDNQKKLKLLGIRINPHKRKEAMNYLKNKLKSKKILVKYDHPKDDKHNILTGYIYLKNKTFINAKLIKEGFAFSDSAVDHKYKNRFVQYEKEARSGISE